MDIAPTAPRTDTAQQPASAAPDPDAPAAISSDFETFLKLLTTQLQNQDPLNPLESQDFAVQLATFSGVEQQVRTNDLLKGLGGSLGLTGLSQLAGWVGMEARVTTSVSFDGAPVTLAPEAASGADAAILVVRDSLGREVSREPLPPSTDTIEWVGVGTDGRPLPPGTYDFTLESLSDGEVLSVAPVPHFATVREARLDGDAVRLFLDGGASVEADAVTGLRLPPDR